jgi:hypothetical protein
MAAPDEHPLAPAAHPARGDAARPARPALRASDADRERTADVLRTACGDGRLTADELDERLDAAYAAVTLDDLVGLTLDLVPAGDRGAHPTAASATPAAPGRVAVRDADDGTHWLVAIMGGTERRGRWRLGRRCRAISVMGGTELDLTHAEFDAHDVHLDVISIMGGAEIRVPEHMNVRVSKFAFMGGHEVRIGADEPDPGGPVLHLHLVSVMGGAEVRRGPKRPRRDGRPPAAGIEASDPGRPHHGELPPGR